MANRLTHLKARMPRADAEWWTSQSLRVGVTISALLVASGFLLLLLRPGAVPAATPLANPIGGFLAPLTHPAGSFAALLANPTGIITVGLLVLIGTSMFRVAAASVAFAFDGDIPHAVISALVFGVLILSYVLGKVE